MSIEAVKFIPLKAIETESIGFGGKGALGAGLPDLSGKAGSFAKMLQGVLRTGGVEGLDMTAQSTLGSQFLATMQGQDVAQLAQTSELNMLMDALEGSPDKASGGSDMMKLMGGLGVNGKSLDMMGLLGSGLPMGLNPRQMTRVMEALKQTGAAPPMNGGAFAALADALSGNAGHNAAQAAQSAAQRVADAEATGRFNDLFADHAPDGAGPVFSAPDAAGRNEVADIDGTDAPAAEASATEGPEAASAAAEPPATQAVPPLPGGPADATLHRMLQLGVTEAPSASLSAARNAMARKAYGGNPASDPFGMLSARFESGGDPAAVGYDRVGGTSYGVYQISSKAGTFDRFLSFLDRRAPEMATRLRAAGSADTGSKTGAMPAAWKTLAHDEPQRFSALQHEFIRETHFQPALKKIAQMTGIDLSGSNQAIAQVLWSTAVQHGATGSARIFAKALDAVGSLSGPSFEKDLIKAVYDRRSKQFGSSTDRVQGAVSDRFKEEMRDVLSLIGAGASMLDSNA